MPRMGKTKEDWNGLRLGFLKTVQPNSFSKLIPAACTFKNNSQKTYLFVSDFWFCNLHVISLLTLSSIAIWGRLIGKIKQNKLDSRDTFPLSGATCMYTSHFIEVSQHYNLSLICSWWNRFVRKEASIWRTYFLSRHALRYI